MKGEMNENIKHIMKKWDKHTKKIVKKKIVLIQNPAKDNFTILNILKIIR